MKKDNSNKSLPLPAEINLIIYENLLEDLVKNCANYDDYRKAIDKINELRCTSQTFKDEINTVLQSIKTD